MKFNSKHLLVSAVLATLGASALAQSPPAGPGGQGPMMQRMQHMQGGQGRPQDGAARRERMEARMAQRMEEFKKKLGISAAQEGAWNAWASAMKPPAQPPQRPDREALARMTTPERIDRMRAMQAEHQTHRDARATATKTFYAALTPDQQKSFDQTTARFYDRFGQGKGGPRGEGGPGMHRHGMHHGHGMQGQGMYGPGMGGPGMGPR